MTEAIVRALMLAAVANNSGGTIAAAGSGDGIRSAGATQPVTTSGSTTTTTLNASMIPNHDQRPGNISRGGSGSDQIIQQVRCTTNRVSGTANTTTSSSRHGQAILAEQLRAVLAAAAGQQNSSNDQSAEQQQGGGSPTMGLMRPALSGFAHGGGHTETAERQQQPVVPPAVIKPERAPSSTRTLEDVLRKLFAGASAQGSTGTSNSNDRASTPSEPPTPNPPAPSPAAPAVRDAAPPPAASSEGDPSPQVQLLTELVLRQQQELQELRSLLEVSVGRLNTLSSEQQQRRSQPQGQEVPSRDYIKSVVLDILNKQSSVQDATADQDTKPLAGSSLQQGRKQELELSVANALTQISKRESPTSSPPLLVENVVAPTISTSEDVAGLDDSSSMEAEELTSATTSQKKHKKKHPRQTVVFPQKLYELLHDLEDEDQSDIASFVDGGKAFCVHAPDEFENEIIPRYFARMGSYASFQRQLNLYDFIRITEGPNRGAYFHKLFVKGQPDALCYMKRNKHKGLAKMKQQHQQ